MPKNIIDENVVITSFEVDENSERVSLNRHRNFSSSVKKNYQELSSFLIGMSNSFNAIVSTLERNTQKLERINQTLIRGLTRLEQKYRQTSISISKTISSTNSGFTNLLRSIGKVEQAIYRLGAGFFVASFSLFKLIDDQRDLFYLSQKLNIPVDEISKYSYVVSQIGGDSEKAKQSLERFTQTLQDMARGQNAEALEIFGRLGLSVYNKDGSIKSVTQAIDEIKKRFENIGSTQTKVNYLKKLGFDENEFNYFLQDVSLLEDRFESLYEKIIGVDANSFLQVSTYGVKNLSNEMRTLTTTLNVIGQYFIYRLLPSLNYLVNSLQVKLLSNSRAVNNTLNAFGELVVKSATLITSFANMLVEFTGVLIDLWNNLDSSERHLLKLGVAFVGFFKLFTSSLLSSPFGRFLTLLSMGLILIQDYIYWKKQMAGENYKAHYDWSDIDKYIEKMQDFLGGFNNPFADWNTGLLELMSNFDVFSVAVMSLIAAMSGKLPVQLGKMVLSHPALAGIATTLIASGLLIQDDLDKQGTGKKSLQFNAKNYPQYLATKLLDDDEMYKDTEKGKELRTNAKYSNPLEFNRRLMYNKTLRTLENITEEEAVLGFKEEYRKWELTGDKNYFSQEAMQLRMIQDKQIKNPNVLISPNNVENVYKQENRPQSNIDKKEKGINTSYKKPELESRVTDGEKQQWFNTGENEVQLVPQQNLGAEKTINNNNNANITVSKGDTNITVNGSADTDAINAIEEAVSRDDDFFKNALSIQSQIDLTNQLYKGY